MTKPNFTSISLIVDESSSMYSVWGSTIEGVNTFIRSQKETPGEAIFSLIKFSDEIDIVHEHAPINLIPDITRQTYNPNGNTALLDAIGTTIDSLGKKFSEMSENDRPSKVIVAIQTDGQENRSRKYTITQIHEMIKHQTDVYNWDFVFLGANQDAISVGQALGIAAASAMTYDSSQIGTLNSFATLGKSITRSRKTLTKSCITEEDRLEYDKAVKNFNQKQYSQPRAANGRFLSKSI